MTRRLILVDDHAAVRQMLAGLLSARPHFQIAAQAADGIEALRVCSETPCDLVILDLNMPRLSGFEVLCELRRLNPAQRVLVFSGSTDRENISAVLAERPSGYVDKQAPLSVLYEALEHVFEGKRFISPALQIYEGATRRQNPPISLRERQVLQLIAEGASSKEIGLTLKIALKTVDAHRTSLMLKLHRHDVASLTRYAIKIGLASPG